MVENFHSIKESVQKFARNTLSFELVPREQLSILMEVIKLSYCSMKIAAPRTYMIYIYVCVPVPSLRPLVSNQLWGRPVKMGEKIIRERAKLKWTQFGGGIFHPLISTVLKSFLEIRYCSQSSYTFSIFFFYIYLLFSLLFSTIVTFSILSFISYRIFFPEEKCTWHNSL